MRVFISNGRGGRGCQLCIVEYDYASDFDYACDVEDAARLMHYAVIDSYDAVFRSAERLVDDLADEDREAISKGILLSGARDLRCLSLEAGWISDELCDALAKLEELVMLEGGRYGEG